MSIGVFVDEFLVQSHKEILGAAGGLVPDTFALWINNIVPSQSTVFANLLLDAGTVQALVAANWVFVLFGPTHTSQAQQQISTTFNAGQVGQTYFGYCLYNAGAGKLFYAERFDAVFSPATAGQILLLVPLLQYQNCV